MSKIFSTQFKNGSLIEKYSGNVFTLAAESSFIKSEKGLTLNNPEVDGYGYITLPSIFNNIASNDVSIELYCKINKSTPDQVKGIFHASYDSTHYIMLWATTGGKFHVTVCDGTYYDIIATDAYNEGQWYHIVITWTAATNSIGLYIDGVLNSTVSSGTNGTATSNLTIGTKSTYHWSVSANVVFGDIQIYDHILTLAEISKLYRSFIQTGPTTKSVPVPLTYPKANDLSRLVDSKLEDDILDGFDVTDAAWTHDCITVWDGYNYLSMGNGQYIKTDSIVLRQGAKYRCYYRLKLTSATNLSFLLRDYDLANTYHTFTWDLGVEQEGYFDFTATTVSGTGIGFEAVNSGSVYLYALQIQELTGLVAAYNFEDSGNNVDISGNGLNDTTTGKVILTDQGKYYHSNGKSVIGDLENIKSIAFRIKFDSTTEKIMEGSAAGLLIHVASGVLTYSDFDNAFINGIDTNTIIAEQWYNIVVTSSTNVDFSACTLGLNDTTYGNFEISELQFYSDEKDISWAREYNNKFAVYTAHKGLLVEDFSVGDSN